MILWLLEGIHKNYWLSYLGSAEACPWEMLGKIGLGNAFKILSKVLIHNYRDKAYSPQS